jgi:hypothetical protein
MALTAIVTDVRAISVARRRSPDIRRTAPVTGIRSFVSGA